MTNPRKKKTEEKSKSKEDKTSEEKPEEDDETIEQVFNTLNEKQKNVVYAMIGQAIGETDEPEDKNDDDSKGGNTEMKHNVFDNDKKNETGGFLTHSAQEDIIKMAKTSQVGTFQTALQLYASRMAFSMMRSAAALFRLATETVTSLFPEYQEVRPGAPELITNDQGWITNVMRKVHKSRFPESEPARQTFVALTLFAPEATRKEKRSSRPVISSWCAEPPIRRLFM